MKHVVACRSDVKQHNTHATRFPVECFDPLPIWRHRIRLRCFAHYMQLAFPLSLHE
jgi:hypothetical protein